MDLSRLQEFAETFLEENPLNHVLSEDALRNDLAGMRIYDAPLLGVAAADSPMFLEWKKPEVVHPEAWMPQDWLDGAMSVISFFLPFTEQVKRSNIGGERASDEWLHVRIEGQMTLNALGRGLCELLEQAGEKAVFPTTDPRFSLLTPVISNWSERHAAYVCGLGTFGLSKGLITQKGMAGRFGSVITTAELPPTEHEYSNPFEYCIMCGKCQQNCPVNAIDVEKGVVHGKDQSICAPYIAASHLPPHGPNKRVRYGCGKCQVNVPCASRNPRKG